MVNGIHNPPPEFLTSGARVREWRRFNNQRQKYEIKRIEEVNAKRAVMEIRNWGRASQIAKREQQSCDDTHIDCIPTGSSTSPDVPTLGDPSMDEGGALKLRVVVGEDVVSLLDTPPVSDADISISPVQSMGSDQGGRETLEGTGASDVNMDVPAPGDL